MKTGKCSNQYLSKGHKSHGTHRVAFLRFRRPVRSFVFVKCYEYLCDACWREYQAIEADQRDRRLLAKVRDADPLWVEHEAENPLWYRTWKPAPKHKVARRRSSPGKPLHTKDGDIYATMEEAAGGGYAYKRGRRAK